MIKFEHEEGYCTTSCPYGVIDGYTGEPRKVGSNSCSDCLYCCKIDTLNDTVDCLMAKDTNNKEK